MKPSVFKRFMGTCRTVSLMARRQRLSLLSRFPLDMSKLAAEAALGRYMPPKAHIHHVNGNHTDHRNENLVICQDARYHALLHSRAIQRLRGVRVPSNAKGWQGLYRVA